MSDIRVDITTVQSNVRALNTMFDQLESGVRGLNAVRGLQTTTTWTDIPACASFAGTYKRSIDLLQERIDETWQKIRAQAEALRDAATALTTTDQTAQADLATMQACLDALITRAVRGADPIAPRTSGPMRAV